MSFQQEVVGYNILVREQLKIKADYRDIDVCSFHCEIEDIQNFYFLFLHNEWRLLGGIVFKLIIFKDPQ